MIGFFDNDIATLLAACDLLEETVSAFCVTEIRVLSSLKFKMTNVVKRNGNYPSETIDRLTRFHDTSAKVTTAVPDGWLDELGENAAIDSGEAAIFLEAAKTKGLIFTGDKRAMRSLAILPDDLKKGLTARVVPMEVVLEELMNKYGFSQIRSCIVPARFCNKELSSLFGSGLKAEEQSVRSGLTSYFRELASDGRQSLFARASRPSRSAVSCPEVRD